MVQNSEIVILVATVVKMPCAPKHRIHLGWHYQWELISSYINFGCWILSRILQTTGLSQKPKVKIKINKARGVPYMCSSKANINKILHEKPDLVCMSKLHQKLWSQRDNEYSVCLALSPNSIRHEKHCDSLSDTAMNYWSLKHIVGVSTLA